MTIQQKRDGKKLTVALEGNLDTTTSTDLEQFVRTQLDGVESLVFDFSALEYVSSAGLRTLLLARQSLPSPAALSVIHCSKDIMEILDITGFSSILNVK